jgi:phosphoribosylglycinamide formyltransferase 1
MKAISVFASGGGSNLQSIIDQIEQGHLAAKIAFVLSNNSGAKALDRARRHGIPAVHLSVKNYPSPEEYADALLRLHREHQVELVLLAGYMKLLPVSFVREYSGRILNIHPSLLPKYGGQGMYGIHVHEAVLRAGEKESGASVHLVTEAYDEGPVLLQERVPVLPGDTPELLAKRVLEVEHRIYPEAVRRALENQTVPR